MASDGVNVVSEGREAHPTADACEEKRLEDRRESSRGRARAADAG